MNIAVITGASSGLGWTFAQHLSHNKQVDAIWAIARREDRLNQLTQELPCPVHSIPLDLTKSDSLDRLEILLRQTQPTISFLICAAGFGMMGPIADAAPEAAERMIDLNCKAVVRFTSLCLPYLHRGSQILEISSTAAFQPMPGIGLYAASKAFLESYTKTLHYELLSSGIHVTAVCPYWIKDTEFIPVAKDGKKGSFKHFPLASRAKSVVRLSLLGSKFNLWVVTPGIVCTIHRIAAKLIPHCLMTPLADLIRRL